jgi:transcriptional regulator with XRE-family HTH domain
MAKNSIDNNKVLKRAIEQWPVRIRRARKRQLDLAVTTGISEGHLSHIMNFKIKNPHLRTLNKIEEVLSSWEV